MHERRRTRRVSLRIPIFVDGIDQSGNRFTEQGTTIEVNRDGARIALRNTPRLGAEVQITNLLTNATALFRTVVRCPQNYASVPEWGVVLTSPLSELVPEFWDVAFEDWSAQSEPELEASALLRCRKCGRREMVGLTAPEYRVLLARKALPRVCAVCRASTVWEAAPAELPRFMPAPSVRTEDRHNAPLPEAHAATPGLQAPAPQVQRRGARRVAVQVPLLIRAFGDKTEQSTSRNVSKSGLSFATSLDVDTGDEIEIVVGYGVAKSPATQKARVVWRRPETKGVQALVGVQFTGTRPAKVPKQAPAAETRRSRRGARRRGPV